MFTLNDPDTFWLTLTNIGLGVVTLICCVVVAAGIVQEVVLRVRRSRALRSLATDDHALLITGLGVTMADGGVPVDAETPMYVTESGLARKGSNFGTSDDPDEPFIYRSEN